MSVGALATSLQAAEFAPQVAHLTGNRRGHLKTEPGLGNVAAYKFPIPGLSKHFPMRAYECPVRKHVALKLVHKLRGGIAQVAVDAVHARE